MFSHFYFPLLSAYSPPRSAEKWAAICYRFIWWRFMQMTHDLWRLNFFFRRPVLVVWSSLGDDCRPERPLHQHFHFARDAAEKILTKMYSIESVNKTFFVVLLLQTGNWVQVPQFHQIVLKHFQITKYFTSFLIRFRKEVNTFHSTIVETHRLPSIQSIANTYFECKWGSAHSSRSTLITVPSDLNSASLPWTWNGTGSATTAAGSMFILRSPCRHVYYLLDQFHFRSSSPSPIMLRCQFVIT